MSRPAIDFGICGGAPRAGRLRHCRTVSSNASTLSSSFSQPADPNRGYIIVYQQVENMVLSPRITSRTTALHPAVAFGAVIAGGAVIGPIGALLALPAAASVQALVSTYLHRYEVVASPLTRPSG